jgi:hypothetical protein
VVKRCPKITNRVPNGERNNIRDGFGENGLVDMLSTFRVRLYDYFVWIVIEEPENFSLDIVDVMLCATNLKP